MKNKKLFISSKVKGSFLFTVFVFLFTIGMQAQEITVQGVVTATEDGMPVPGVTVLVKGTTIGTTTNFDGEYTIEANKGGTLVFSFIGMIEQSVKIENGKIDISMGTDTQSLDEVMVIGYGKIKKSDVTGSVSSVSAKQLTQTQASSIAMAIQGRAAGVTVAKTSGQPGATPTVRIRGIGTVNNADPLYIVDGVPINDISNINMDDAKSVEILKDASATAIYGSRGANGVVLITTKGGSKTGGKPVISFRTYAGVETRIDNLDVMNAEQWATIYNEGKVNDGLAPDPALENPSSLTSYDWKDAVYQTGSVQNYQLSVSGGGDKYSYYVSYGNFNQKGIVDNTSFKRDNFRVNSTYELRPKIKLGQNIQYANSKSNSVASFGSNSNFKTPFIGYVVDPVSPIYNADGSPARPLYSTEVRNPVGLTMYDQSPVNNESFLGNIFLEIDIMDGLMFRTNYGLEVNNRKVDNFKPEYFISAEQNREVNEYVLQRSENRVSIWSNTLNYTTVIKEKHSINALLGQESQKLDFNNVNASRNAIPDGVENPTLGSGAVDSSTNDGGISSSQLLSFFARFNYNYDERYLFTGTFRMDGSSRFGENNKYANFPSLALAWNIHNEAFYNIDFINQFKFRVGWGETGNQNIPISAIYSTLSTSENYLLGNDETTAVGLAPLRPGNPDLKWETTTTTNFGLDLAFLNNSITFTADYWIKNTNDLLLETPILNTSGYGLFPTVNAGEIENKGLEFTLNYKKSFDDFFFSIGGNFSMIDNKVISLATEGSAISTGTAGNGFTGISRTEAGRPLASFYGLEAIGIFQNQAEIDNNASLNGNLPGDVQYRDLDNNGVINDDDRTFIGSPLADFTYGINLDMSYKQFDLSMFFLGTQGNDILDATGPLLVGGLETNLSTEFLNRWTGEGTSDSMPRATFDGFANNNRLSSRFVEDGSFFKLKNVQLGYSFSEDVLDKTFISSVRLYLAGQNLFTITNYSGLDPELGIDETQEGRDGSRTSLDIGIDRGRYPSSRTVSLGLDINF